MNPFRMPRFWTGWPGVAVVFVGLAAGAFSRPAVAGEPETTLRVVGSTTVLPIAARAAQQFSDDHRGQVRITVNPGGSGVGINSVGQGQADIGMASREITARERERFEDADLRVHVIARDAVACVVSAEVYEAGVRALSREQIRDIYSGRIRNWKAVGGPDRPIVVIDKEHHRGTRHVFMAYVFGHPQARAPGARLVTGSNNEEQAKIAQSEAAIGMLSFAWVNERVRAVGLREDGQILTATRESVRSGRYPLVRNLNFVTRGEPRGWVKRFMDFIRGPRGHRIVQKSGYWPQDLQVSRD